MRNKSRKLTSCYFFIMLSFILLVFTACSTKPECKNFEKNYSLIKVTDTFELFNFLNLVIAKNSKCIDALLARGDLHFSKNNLKRAIEDYNIVLQNDKNNIYALYQLGVLYQVDEKLDSSLIYLNQALSRKRNGDIIIDNKVISKKLMLPSDKYDILSSEIIYQMGISYYHKREMSNALASFDYCLRDEYKLGSSHLYRGAIFYESSKPDSACIAFRLAGLNGSEFASEYLSKFCK